jgi:Uncharacterized protein conserved in bacteria
MVKLLIIADDFTGAMDTGVQFAARGAVTRVVTDPLYDFTQASPETQVLVMDAETRHLTASDAYSVVFRAARATLKARIFYIYKKTDSALRGNVGSELAALMDATGYHQLPFIPAFPSMNRITKEGIHYIENIPVADSVFGSDPFEPVRFSSVRSILAEQTDKTVTVCTAENPQSWETAGIQVFDAQTNDDLRKISHGLGTERVHISAGCAGFASELAAVLRLDGAPPELPTLVPALFIFCGSVNPVTQNQLAEAERAGFKRIRLTVWQKLDPMWQDSEDCRREVARWKELTKKYDRLILDTNDPDGSFETQEYMKLNNLTIEDVRVRISTVLGRLMKMLLDDGLQATLLCTGGDTLLALMRAVQISELTPVCELDTGVVLTSFLYQGKTYHIISKSGGFGAPDLLGRLAELIGTGKREETVC